MTRTELIDTLAEKTGTDRKGAKETLDALTAIVEDEISKDTELVPLVRLQFRGLAEAQRNVLTEIGKTLEVESTKMFPDFVKKDHEVIQKAGVKIYKLSPEKEKKLLEITQEAGWTLVLDKAPDAKALRPLMSKK